MDILTEMDRRVYAEELKDRLPDRLFDAHLHLWERRDFPETMTFEPKNYINHFDGHFSLAEWTALLPDLLPGKEVEFNAFGFPDDAVDLDSAPACPFHLSLVSPFDPVEKLAARMERSGSLGVKPYWNFARKPAAETEVRDMLTPEQLDYLDRRKAIVTFHIPRPGRFEDPLNQRQMAELCERWPNIAFIFAHIGRAYYLRNIRRSNLDELARYPNCYFDTAMLNHLEVFRYTLDHFPAERLLFGSDAPVALLHGKSVEINNSYLYLCAEDYRIGSMVYIPGKRETFTLFYYEQLRALLEAVPTALQKKIFYENAHRLFTERSPR